MGWFDPKQDIDFMRLSKPVIIGSFVAILATIAGIWWPGAVIGTDFSGGTEVEVELLKPVDATDVRAAVAKSGFHSPDVVTVQNPAGAPQFLIRVQEVATISEATMEALRKQLCLQPEDQAQKLDESVCPPELQTTEVKFSPGGEKVTARYLENHSACEGGEIKSDCKPREDIRKRLAGTVPGVELVAGDNNPVVQSPQDNKVEFRFKSKGDQIMDALRAHLGDDVVPAGARRIEWIGPKAGKQLRDAAITSISISLLLIMLYVAFRFDVRFAPGGILALIHDVVIAFGGMILFQREITLSTVAALLTIVGFSINDTVVIYDRIRENLGKYRGLTFPQVINKSVTETLSRTIKTSGATMSALVPFLFWGTSVIRDFALCLLIGMVAGVYSTIFIASPVTEFLDRKVFGGLAKKKKRHPRKKKDPGGAAPAPA